MQKCFPCAILIPARKRKTSLLRGRRQAYSFKGRVHDKDSKGNILYSQKPSFSYSLNSDFYRYEMGDVIGLGDKKVLYYCFPLDGGDIVAKARLAAEEMYTLDKAGLLDKK